VPAWELNYHRFSLEATERKAPPEGGSNLGASLEVSLSLLPVEVLRLTATVGSSSEKCLVCPLMG